jgi:peptidoglycan glycosyltransferase
VKRRVLRLAALHLGLLFLVAAWAGYWQVVRGPDLAYHPANPRVLLAEEHVYRGRILDRNHEVVARTVRRGGRMIREYPAAELFAHPVGYRSLLLGKSGLEASMEAQLLSMVDAGPWEELRRRTGEARRGLDVVTTLDTFAQRAAWEALGARAGAVVVLEVETGEVLASVSRPSFDPNRLEQTWAELRWSRSAPLQDRALVGLYPPGRTFGVVVLSAALSRGLVEPATPVECGGPQRMRSVREILQAPCERALVGLSIRVGGRVLREMAEAFGLGQVPTPDAPAAAGQLPGAREWEERKLEGLFSEAGRLLASPLQMASVATTVARRGERVVPHFVHTLRGPDGRELERRARSPAVRIVTPEVADAVQEALRAAGGGPVAGVGSTVTLRDRRKAGWFVGFGPGRSPQVAVAVLVEDAGEQVAGAVAQKVLKAALPRVP